MVNQSRIKATRNAPRYKFGYRIPRNYSEAMQFDLKNGNTLWREATDLEMSQLAEYDTFRDLGHKDTAPPPTGYKKIRTHLVYDCKHDGRHKARMVADGHLTDIPLESVYSGVVSLRGLRIVTFLSELNGLVLWATDIGNAYLEAFTMERNYIVAGPEFGQLEGHYLIIVKALYGLRTSGLRWHERFADCLRNEGFSPCKAEPDIWMRLNGDLYEYVATYVDDLCLGMLDPKSFTDTLQKKYNFKLKGTGPIDFHLGQSFSRNDDGEMEISAKCYVDKMIVDTCYMFRQYFAPKGSDKICMMTTRLACNRAIESSYWRMDNDSDVGLLTGYVLYRLPVELEFMDLDTFTR
jgi:hypothetical protein